MKIKTLFLFLSIFLLKVFVSESKAQTKELIVYKTYEDYVAKKGTAYKGEYKAKVFVKKLGKKNRSISFVNKDKKAVDRKVKVTLKEVWGFSLNGLLFRVDEKTACPHYIRSQGKACYYENGYAVLHKLKKKDPSLDVNMQLYMDPEIPEYEHNKDRAWGYVAYFSETLDSDFVIFTKKKFYKFVKQNSKYKEIYDCVFSEKKGKRWKKRRTCFKTYNGA